jgi:hemerythrin-like domain-containing protein
VATAVPGPEAAVAEQRRDVISILTDDHREVDKLFTELERTIGATDEAARRQRKEVLDRVTIELVRHSVAEEAEVYPLIKARVSDAEAEHAKHEHTEVERMMKLVDGLAPDHPMFDKELMGLITAVRQHIAEEETQMLPKMRSRFSADELFQMGERVERVKALSPTRPHPAAPHEPPGIKLLGPVAGLLDRMRDAVSGRGRSG